MTNLLNQLEDIHSFENEHIKSWHITFMQPNEIISRGKTYQAYNAIAAIKLFNDEYPNATLLYIASSDLFKLKFGYGD